MRGGRFLTDVPLIVLLLQVFADCCRVAATHSPFLLHHVLSDSFVFASLLRAVQIPSFASSLLFSSSASSTSSSEPLANNHPNAQYSSSAALLLCICQLVSLSESALFGIMSLTDGSLFPVLQSYVCDTARDVSDALDRRTGPIAPPSQTPQTRLEEDKRDAAIAALQQHAPLLVITSILLARSAVWVGGQRGRRSTTEDKKIAEKADQVVIAAAKGVVQPLIVLSQSLCVLSHASQSPPSSCTIPAFAFGSREEFSLCASLLLFSVDRINAAVGDDPPSLRSSTLSSPSQSPSQSPSSSLAALNESLQCLQQCPSSPSVLVQSVRSIATSLSSLLQQNSGAEKSVFGLQTPLQRRLCAALVSLSPPLSNSKGDLSHYGSLMIHCAVLSSLLIKMRSRSVTQSNEVFLMSLSPSDANALRTCLTPLLLEFVRHLPPPHVSDRIEERIAAHQYRSAVVCCCEVLLVIMAIQNKNNEDEDEEGDNDQLRKVPFLSTALLLISSTQSGDEAYIEALVHSVILPNMKSKCSCPFSSRFCRVVYRYPSQGSTYYIFWKYSHVRCVHHTHVTGFPLLSAWFAEGKWQEALRIGANDLLSSRNIFSGT